MLLHVLSEDDGCRVLAQSMARDVIKRRSARIGHTRLICRKEDSTSRERISCASESADSLCTSRVRKDCRFEKLLTWTLEKFREAELRRNSNARVGIKGRCEYLGNGGGGGHDEGGYKDAVVTATRRVYEHVPIVYSYLSTGFTDAYVGLSFPRSHSLTDPRFLYSISISAFPPSDHPANVPATPIPAILLLLFFFSFPLFSTTPRRFRSTLSARRCLIKSSVASQPSNSALLTRPVAGTLGTASGATSKRGSYDASKYLSIFDGRSGRTLSGEKSAGGGRGGGGPGGGRGPGEGGLGEASRGTGPGSRIEVFERSCCDSGLIKVAFPFPLILRRKSEDSRSGRSHALCSVARG